MRKLFAPFSDGGINLPSQANINPDYEAPIIRNEAGGPRLAMVALGHADLEAEAIYEAAKTVRADKLHAKGKEVDFDELLKDGA
jgi:hypothetical protein